MISKEDIDKIFDIAKIEDVISDFITLKKSGVNYKGLSPFSNERTPSFVVSPVKQIWKDFSSGKGGNVISFLMELENYTYPEALRYLAKKYGIELHEKEISKEEKDKQSEKESVYIIHEKVQKKFVENLNSNLGKSVAYSYFKNRGFKDNIIQKFGLGYASDKYDDVSSFLIKSGYPKELLEISGVSTIKNGKIYDRFRDRVIFPIHTFSGRVIGFGARILSDKNNEAKYLNSPETPIYSKSNTLYGIYFSKKSISSLDSCILLEGYTDVISFYQNGVENVVSSSGTALTREQCQLIKRLTNNITIIYDSDLAGIKASLRGVNLLLEEGMNISLVMLPDEEDPDTFSKKNSSEELKNYIEKNTMDFVSFLIKINKNDIENSPLKKSQLLNDIISYISIIKSPIDRELFVQKTSQLLDISKQTLFNQLSIIDKNNAYKEKKELKPIINKSKLDYIDKPSNYDLELDVLNILLNFNDAKDNDNYYIYDFIIDELKGEDIEFEEEINKELFKVILENYKQSKKLDLNFFYRHNNPDIVKRVIDISFKIEKIDKWHKRNILIKDYSEKIPKESIDIIRKFKLQKIEKMIQEEIDNLKNINDEKEKEIKMGIILDLSELRDEILKKIFNN